jgi:hypothetical protein
VVSEPSSSDWERRGGEAKGAGKRRSKEQKRPPVLIDYNNI